MLFHTGRLVSFAVLGGVLGLVGSAIGINFTFTAILGILASVVMLLLGGYSVKKGLEITQTNGKKDGNPPVA